MHEIRLQPIRGQSQFDDINVALRLQLVARHQMASLRIAGHPARSLVIVRPALIAIRRKFEACFEKKG